MKAEDHIVAYVESDATYYARLIELNRRINRNGRDNIAAAAAAFGIARDAYSDMLRNGSALSDDPYSPGEIIAAAAQFAAWEEPA